MKETTRTPKQSAQLVQKAILEVHKVLNAVPLMKGYKWFNDDLFKKSGKKQLIKDICKSNGISEKHIRTVAGWED
ncbi:MAG: hypothetical protein QNK20_16695 [Aureibaculum sp.]|nr:hypothetical protein [Aureibaculum sp.]